MALDVKPEELLKIRIWSVEAILAVHSAAGILPAMSAVMNDAHDLVKFVLGES